MNAIMLLTSAMNRATLCLQSSIEGSGRTQPGSLVVSSRDIPPVEVFILFVMLLNAHLESSSDHYLPGRTTHNEGLVLWA